MKNNYGTLLSAFMLFFSGSIFAQDPTFSNLDANRTYYNPAFAGIDPGMRIAFNYRNQWTSVPSTFTTYNFSFEASEFNMGLNFGVFAQKNIEGEGNLSTTSLAMSINKAIITRSNLQWTMAVRPGFVTKHIDWSKLQFSDQFDPVYGMIYPSAALAPVSESKTFRDIDVGSVIRFNAEVDRRIFTNTLGFSVSHLEEPDESLLGTDQKLPLKYSLQMGTYFLVKKKRTRYKTKLAPNLLIEHQSQFNSLTAGCAVITQPVFFGFAFRSRTGFGIRNSDSVILSTGIKNEMNDNKYFTFVYSYDMTVSGLATKSGGSHELSLIMNLEDTFLFNLRSNAAKRRARDCSNYKGGFIPVWL